MDAVAKPIADTSAVTEFVARWKGNTGSERANFQSFMRELCELLQLPLPSKSDAQAEAEEELLMRVVALNKQRAAEEAQGKVRWLRPAYQAPDATQIGAELATEQAEAATAAVPAVKGKAAFPKAVPEQLKVLREALAERPHTVESLADLFKRKPRKSIEEGLLSLSAVGRADYEELSGIWYAAV